MRLFKTFIPASILGLLASELALITACYIVAVVLMVDVDPQVFLLYDAGWWRIAIVTAGLVAGMYFQDLYRDLKIRSRMLLAQQVCLVVGIAFLLQALLSYVSPQWILPRWTMMTGSGLALVTLPLWRMVYGSLVLSAVPGERLLYLGMSPLVQAIAQELEERPEFGFVGVGYVDDVEQDEADGKFAGGKWLGSLDSLSSVVAATKPSRIVVGLPERRQRLPLSVLLDLRFSGVTIEDAATTYETAFQRVCAREIRPSQLIFSAELGPRQSIIRLQALYSTLLALVGLALTLLLMLVAAALVKLTSRGPILYRQRRVGLQGSTFILYKFRSMYADAEDATGAVWAVEDDPRVTPVGRWLRRLRFDEFPQLFNVLRGEMAIVGPRPERPEFVSVLAEQIPYYRQRHSVKPGITGWAQINHKYGNTLEDTITKLEYDLYYIKHLAPVLDAYIIFHTLKVMLLGRGSH